MSQPPASQPHHNSILWALPFTQLAWELTPPTVQDYIKSQNQQIAQLQRQMGQCQSQIEQLQRQVETLPGRVAQTSQTSSKPPSSDSPFNKPKRQRKTSSGTRGGQKGHCGRGPTFLSPTEVHLIEPAPCACGHDNVGSLTPYHTHQGIELPPIEMEIHHFVLHQGHCQRSGMHRTSWRLMQGLGSRGAYVAKAVTMRAPYIQHRGDGGDRKYHRSCGTAVLALLTV